MSHRPDATPRATLYGVVTSHWTKLSAALVVCLGLVELIVGGLTANSGVEYYLMAWAGTTGGLWFLFDKAETALSEESRARMVGWMKDGNVGSSIASLPDQFALLFDRVFGERHLSWRCFGRSSLASCSGALMVYVLLGSLGGFDALRDFGLGGGWALAVFVPAALVGSAVLYNLIPDYLSLLETRWAIRFISGVPRAAVVLLLDLVLTAGIFLAWTYAAAAVLATIGVSMSWQDSTDLIRAFAAGTLTETQSVSLFAQAVYFFTTFFTSAWLWLYAASAFLARILVKMNSGVGFLFSVTDFERQPFRSVGFVSVLITSAVFLVGLPLALL